MGKSGLEVSFLSLFTGTFRGVGEYYKAWLGTQLKGTIRLIDICLDTGINLFDTADVYSKGLSEEILGKTLTGKNRDKLLLLTKATFNFGEGPNNQGSSRFRLIRQLEGSLKRLETDYIDIYHMHSFDGVTAIEEALRALDDMVSSKKVRYISASNFSSWLLIKSIGISDKYGWNSYVAHQVYYSLANREYEWELMPLSIDQNIGTIVWSPLSSGRLGGRYKRNNSIPKDGRIAQGGTTVPDKAVQDNMLYNILDTLQEVANEVGKSVAQVAINWVLQLPTISSVIIGARNEDQFKQNLGAVGWNLTEARIRKLDEASNTSLIYPYWQQWSRKKLIPTPLFSPLQIKELTLKNRIVMSPMCQYSAVYGFANDWHYVHYVSRSVGGAAVVIQEATIVVPVGRISYADLGIWKDEHIDEFKKMTTSIEKYGAIPGIQLAHAGRKASCDLANNGGAQIKDGPHAWETVAPSAIPFLSTDIAPTTLSEDGIKEVANAFKEATIRSIKAGYKVIEIHAAHGYLIHEFFSPLTNNRTDNYGDSFENRVRILFDIIDEILPLMKDDLSLWIRISATDWVEGGWDLPQSIELSKLLKAKGIDVIDVSTGGLVADAKILVGKNYQVPFVDGIRQASGLITGAVGLFTEAPHMEELLETEKCDLIFIGRKLLKDSYFPINVARELGDTDITPDQYGRRH